MFETLDPRCFKHFLPHSPGRWVERTGASLFITLSDCLPFSNSRYQGWHNKTSMVEIQQYKDD